MKTNFQKGFVVPLVIAIVVLAIAGGIYYTSTRNKDSSINGNGQELDGLIDRSASTTPLVGGDRDSHGCIGSAGYLWSEQKQQCVRPWEENASPTNITASCTKEARSCPDGSTVGRVAPSCAFRACPTGTTTSGWKTYTNSHYGFQIQYPKTWNVVEGTWNGVGNNNVILRKDGFIPAAPGDFDVAINVGIRKPVSATLTSNAKVAGIEATKIESIAGTQSGPRTEYYVEKNSVSYQIVLDYNNPRDYVADEILSTFKFTN